MLSMRITGGKYCNRKVYIPQGELEIRPAMDRMRESLFSILGPLNNCSFLDLFSGSGCIGLEAASRGAVKVDMVELDRKRREIMEKNIEWAQDECEIKIFFANVLQFIPKCHESYDIVYADPPFPMSGKTNIADLAARCRIVKPQGLFIIHIPTAEEKDWPETIHSFTMTDKRKYGRNMIIFYKNNF